MSAWVFITFGILFCVKKAFCMKSSNWKVLLQQFTICDMWDVAHMNDEWKPWSIHSGSVNDSLTLVLWPLKSFSSSFPSRLLFMLQNPAQITPSQKPSNFFSFYLFSECIWLCQVLVAAYGILVPWPGIEPRTPALGAWSLSHWTTREVPRNLLLPQLKESQMFCGWWLLSTMLIYF